MSLHELIKASWEQLEDDDISTERLIRMVADSCNCSEQEVISAVFTETQP